MNPQQGDALYLELLQLKPNDEVQKNLKAQAVTSILKVGLWRR